MKKTKDEDGLMFEQIFSCTCSDFAHTFKVITINPNDRLRNQEFIVEVSLDESAGFWKRLKIAVNYLFTGRSCKWDRVLDMWGMLRLKKQLEEHFGGNKPNSKVRKRRS